MVARFPMGNPPLSSGHHIGIMYLLQDSILHVERSIDWDKPLDDLVIIP
jgi:hypothetical protein